VARIDVGEITLNYEERGAGAAFLFIPELVGLYQSEDLHKAVAGSKLVIIEESGHYSYRRHWQKWNRERRTVPARI
jgi:hypothetical protein